MFKAPQVADPVIQRALRDLERELASPSVDLLPAIGAARSSDFTAEPGQAYKVDTTDGDIGVTLIDGAKNGEKVGLCKTSSSNSINVSAVGDASVVGDATLSSTESAIFVFSEANLEWWRL